jgi:hypothetical protein
MLTALVLASLTQITTITIEQSVPVSIVYEVPVVQRTAYQVSSLAPELRPVSATVYSLPGTYSLGTTSLVSGVYSLGTVSQISGVYSLGAVSQVQAYPLAVGGRTVIKERWPGFRSRTVFRNW